MELIIIWVSPHYCQILEVFMTFPYFDLQAIEI